MKLAIPYAQHAAGSTWGNLILVLLIAALLAGFIAFLIDQLSGKAAARKIDRQRRKWK